MILCPDCRGPYAALDHPRCLYCDWELRTEDGLPVMLADRDRSDATFNQYTANYAQIAEDDLRSSIQEPAYLAEQTDRLARLAGPVHDRDVCDIGVGQGGLLERWRGRGAATVTGVDIATPYLRRLRDRDARLLVANAENLPFRSEFDLLVAADVLEHVLNPGDMLISAHDALRTGGRFVVRVPYRESLESYGQLRGSPYRFVHLRSFTRDLLRLMLEQAGFRVERLVLDGFQRTRLRPALRRNERVHNLVGDLLDRRYGTDEALHGIDNRLGRLLLRPNTLTAVARREDGPR